MKHWSRRREIMDRSKLFDSHLTDSLRAIGKLNLLLSSH